jgi:lysophospholipase L1-like esterase
MSSFFKSVFVRYKAKLAGFLLLVILVSFAMPGDKKIRVYLVGDSTMCLYDLSRFPQMGWGMPFANFFDSTVIVDNRAKGGRSTKSFIAENLWTSILQTLSEGDYVLIQFGHNDAANSKDHPNRMVTPEEYRKYLIQYITEARNKKGIPVLITPVTRRTFDNDGKVTESHAPFKKAMVEVATEYKVPLIDLDAKSQELVQKMGPDFSRYMYMNFEPGELPLFPAGIHDNTHFNEFGARKMAEIVLGEIRSLNLELASHIVKPRSMR